MAKDKKEKDVEKDIRDYLKSIDAVEEGNQGWQVTVKKWDYTGVIHLQTPWCPDITGLYMGVYFWIEVKKNQEEVDKWLKIEDRFNGIWKPLPEPYYKNWKLCDSYKREKDQIAYKEKILRNKWTFILTCELQEVIDFILEIDFMLM